MGFVNLVRTVYILTGSLISAGAVSQTPVQLVSVDPISSIPITPSTDLVRYPALGEILVIACPGEAEAYSVVIQNQSDYEISVKPSVSKLVGADQTILASHVDIKYVLWWYQAGGAWDSHRRVRNHSARLIPELLANDPELVRISAGDSKNYLKVRSSGKLKYRDISDRQLAVNQQEIDTRNQQITDAPVLEDVSILPGEHRQIWLDFSVPKNTVADDYVGELIFRSAGGEQLATHPITLRVLPLQLPPPTLEYSLYYRGKYSPYNPTTSSEYKDEHQLRADFQDMLALGIHNPTSYQRSRPKGLLGPKSRREAMSRLRRVLEVRQELGLVGPNFYFLGRLIGFPNSEKQFDQLGSETRELEKLVREFGFDNLYLYGKDEAKGERLREQRESWTFVKSKGARVFVAGTSGHTAMMGNLTDLLVQHGSPSREEADLAHKHGSRIFSYSNPQIGVENPATFRRNYGFELWRAGFDGVMAYAYQHAMGDPWNDFDHKIYRDLMIAYPSSDGPIRTLAWYGLREAIDDMRYLAALIEESNKVPNGSKRDDELKQLVNSILAKPDITPEKTRRRIVRALVSSPDR